MIGLTYRMAGGCIEGCSGTSSVEALIKNSQRFVFVFQKFFIVLKNS